jgi:hypothetical protein
MGRRTACGACLRRGEERACHPTRGVAVTPQRARRGLLFGTRRTSEGLLTHGQSPAGRGGMEDPRGRVGSRKRSPRRVSRVRPGDRAPRKRPGRAGSAANPGSPGGAIVRWWRGD